MIRCQWVFLYLLTLSGGFVRRRPLPLLGTAFDRSRIPTVQYRTKPLPIRHNSPYIYTVRSHHVSTNGFRTKCDLGQSQRVFDHSATKLAVDHSLPMREDIHKEILPNGLEFLMLPTKKAGQTEVHLEILSGSASELDHQQGALRTTPIIDIITE